MKIPMLAIAATCVLAGPVAAQTADIPLAIEGTRLDVVATGESRQVPDLAIVNAGVVTEAPTAAAALAENNRRMAAVFAALRRDGIAERDIQTASISLNARYDYSERSEPRLLGYTASNQLSVRFRDVERAGTIIDTLVGQGVNQINGPSLQVDEPEAALDEARRDAVRKARSRAELYAQAAGMRVERIVAISEAGAARPPVPMANRAMEMDASGGSLQIAPGEQRLSATVSVTFELR